MQEKQMREKGVEKRKKKRRVPVESEKGDEKNWRRKQMRTHARRDEKYRFSLLRHPQAWTSSAVGVKPQPAILLIS